MSSLSLLFSPNWSAASEAFFLSFFPESGSGDLGSKNGLAIKKSPLEQDSCRLFCELFAKDQPKGRGGGVKFLGLVLKGEPKRIRGDELFLAWVLLQEAYTKIPVASKNTQNWGPSFASL